MSYSAFVGAVSVRGIPEGNDLVVIGLEVLLPDSLSIDLEHYHHEGPHEEAGVRLLVKLVRAIVIDAIVLELGVLYMF